MEPKTFICEAIEEKRGDFIRISDRVWDFAEIRFDAGRSAGLLADYLAGEGFSVTRGVAGMEDAFVAVWGSGEPVVGILAEYDALSGMSQVSGLDRKEALEAGGNGHGCGHNLLGAGAVAGAVGIKAFLENAGDGQALAGTIKLFGCPAEESGFGKAFMARAGVFEGVDAFLTWHPFDFNALWGSSTLAVYQVYFDFKGVSSHAGYAPELGRSALDAAELMNIGVNFLREHLIDEARIHYAFMDVGGQAANVVQASASLFYIIRAPKTSQVQEIFERVVKVAQGAAMMTETEVSVRWDAAAANYIVNRTLGDAMYRNMEAVVPGGYCEEDDAAYEAYAATLDEKMRNALRQKLRGLFPRMGADELERLAAAPINSWLADRAYSDKPMTASTDVGDASWFAPTAQMMAAAMPNGTAPHSWQWVAAGKSPVAHKAMLKAGKVIAMTALDLLQDPAILRRAKEEHAGNLGGEAYRSAIPLDVVPGGGQ